MAATPISGEPFAEVGFGLVRDGVVLHALEIGALRGQQLEAGVGQSGAEKVTLRW
jgi:hypothetical protein